MAEFGNCLQIIQNRLFFKAKFCLICLVHILTKRHIFLRIGFFFFFIPITLLHIFLIFLCYFICCCYNFQTGLQLVSSVVSHLSPLNAEEDGHASPSFPPPIYLSLRLVKTLKRRKQVRLLV